MRKIRLRIFFLLVSLWAISAVANAATVSQLIPYNSVGPGISLGIFTVDPFDTSLGTLDEVRVSIDGQIIITGSGLGIIPYDLRLGLDFHGLAGQYFDFSDPGLQFIYQGTLPYQSCSIAGCQPVPGPLLITPTTFNLDFSFDRVFQELTGLNQGFIDDFAMGGATGASPPTVISGAVTDFHETLAGINQMELLVTSTQVGQILSFTTTIGGTMSLTYDYTPSPIPIPAAVWLFGTALIGLAGFSKRKKQLRFK